MDLRRILARKRQQLESLEAQIRVLQDEVATLDRALEIAAREEGKDVETSGEGASTRDSKIDPLPPQHPLSVGEQRPTGRLIAMIREIVRDLREPFSTVDVRNEMKNRDAELFASSHYSSLSGTMRRMAKTGELVAVEKGGPGKEATYRRPSNDSQKPRPEDRADSLFTLEGEREIVESAR